MVGKFSPLHKGHELLISAAISACDEVYVISYAKPGYDRCGTEQRERWLSALFPTVTHLVIDDEWLAIRAKQGSQLRFAEVPSDDASEHTHRVFTAWACHEFLGQTINAVFTSEDYGDGFAEVLTTYFRTQAKQSEPVTHVCVDKARSLVPVSGTKVRREPYNYRKFLSQEVYDAFVDRIVVYGGESTGKTTFCQALAARLKTKWVPEYGRELWIAKNGQLELQDMTAIGETQIQHENEKALEARRWLICDTSPLTTLFYSDVMFGSISDKLLQSSNKAYAYAFICAPDFGFIQDGTRQDETFRDRQHAWYLQQMKARNTPYTLLSGDLETRVSTALATIEEL